MSKRFFLKLLSVLGIGKLIPVFKVRAAKPIEEIVEVFETSWEKDFKISIHISSFSLSYEKDCGKVFKIIGSIGVGDIIKKDGEEFARWRKKKFMSKTYSNLSNITQQEIDNFKKGIAKQSLKDMKDSKSLYDVKMGCITLIET